LHCPNCAAGELKITAVILERQVIELRSLGFRRRRLSSVAIAET